MKSTIRTFIAIKIIPENELKSFVGKAKIAFQDDSIKWVDEAGLHLTLRFFGKTSNDQVQIIISLLEKIASQTKKFSIKLKGTGYFKNRKEPNVLYINVGNAEILKNLAALIDKEINTVGFVSENRTFKPHLTLGRIKSFKNTDRFFRFMSDWKEHEFQTVFVEEFIYFQSILTKDGTIYKPLGKFKLI